VLKAPGRANQLLAAPLLSNEATYDQVQRFINNGPFKKNGVWGKIEIHRCVSATKQGVCASTSLGFPAGQLMELAVPTPLLCLPLMVVAHCV
jgi:hypothetical protein